MARVFDGSASNYFAATGLQYNLPTNCSIVWRAKTSSDTLQVVMGARNTISSGGFFIARSDAFDSCYIALVGDNEYFKATASWPADGSYHNFIITKAGTSLSLYVDSTTAVATATSGAYNSQTESDLYIGAWNAPGAANAFNGSLYDVAIFPVVLGSTDRSNFLGGTAPSGLTAAGTDHYWPLDNAAAGNESDSFGSATLTEVGTVTYESTVVAPVITGPSGAAGAATSTANIAENATTGPTFSTSAALGGGYPTLTGAQAANWSITALTATSWRADPVAAFNFEASPTNPQTVVFNASASVAQTCTITIVNMPEFSGTVPAQSGITGASFSLDLSPYFGTGSFTYAIASGSLTGSGLSLNTSSGVISGTLGTVAVYTVTVSAAGAIGSAVNTNSFAITVSSTGTAPTVSTHPSNTTVTAGATASFTAAAGGSPTPTVQWQENTGSWSNISGQTTTTLSLGVVGTPDNGRQFRAVFTNSSGSATTNTATLTVNAAAGDGTITSEPLKNNMGQLLGAATLSWVGFRNASTGADVLLLTSVAVNSSSIFTTGTNAALAPGQLYAINWKTSDGKYGYAWANAV